MGSERVEYKSAGEEQESGVQKLLENGGGEMRGLLLLSEIGLRYWGVHKRYKNIVDTFPEERRQDLLPKKTLVPSIAALEAISDLRMEELHKKGLFVPAVLMYQALACEWDDCVDAQNSDAQASLESAERLWEKALCMISENPNIDEKNKKPLLEDLEEKKAQYIYFESALKNPENFEGLDTFEKLVLAIEMRKLSFGEMAKVMTRVFNGGVKDSSLEEKMANITLGFSLIDGFKDLKEDKVNGTMTESRALVEHAKTLDQLWLIQGSKLILRVMGQVK